MCDNLEAVYNSDVDGKHKGVRKGGRFGVNDPFSLIFYEKLITCAKEINCFRILFAC